MGGMERADDYAIYIKLALSVTGVISRIPVPRSSKVVKSFWTQTDVWDGGVAVKFTSSYGDLSETLSVTAAGVAGDIHEVDHREELNNTFASGTNIIVNVTGESVGDYAELVIVMRPL